MCACSVNERFETGPVESKFTHGGQIILCWYPYGCCGDSILVLQCTLVFYVIEIGFVGCGGEFTRRRFVFAIFLSLSSLSLFHFQGERFSLVINTRRDNEEYGIAAF